MLFFHRFRIWRKIRRWERPYGQGSNPKKFVRLVWSWTFFFSLIFKSALGHDFIGKVDKHGSQKDYSDGFGGKFGVQTDRVDKSAVGFDYKSQVEKHESQTDHKKGFGGKFGIDTDRMDKSAVGYQDQGDKIGTNYLKTKPDISGAKPSNLKARFENLAVHKEEEGKERAAQQKRIRQEKDLLDREQSAKEQVSWKSSSGSVSCFTNFDIFLDYWWVKWAISELQTSALSGCDRKKRTNKRRYKRFQCTRACWRETSTCKHKLIWSCAKCELMQFSNFVEATD